MKNIIIVLTLGFLSGCTGKSNQKETATTNPESNILELTDNQIKNIELKIGAPKTAPVAEIIKLNGKIDVPPQNMVSVSIPLGGYLISTKLLPGMHVVKGENLARLEDQQYIQLQQEYLTAKSRLGFAEKEFERQKELNSSKSSSDKIYQQALVEMNTLKITVKALSEKLRLIGLRPENLTETNLSRYITIPSPINGYVSKVNVNIGKYLSPTDVLCELVDPSDIHLALSVFEKDVAKLAIGQKIWAYTNQNPLKKYPCRIILIGKDFTADRSVLIHCHFDKYDKNLIPGMYMNAEIETKTRTGSVLPNESIVNYNGKTFIFIAKSKNQFEMMEVKTGNSENGFTEVQIGNESLAQNYVLKGAYQLLMTLKNKEE
ncbi:MAG: efflux RND transporter periplasmic adaptor subunit [Saprospiraceae bacterium]|jgi:cobalt-zinc-cadmium efflux system membrane fusion protein|nr:efflux RND transporter periplasmic adaptor subunit [Saprospiraceae bacterium]